MENSILSQYKKKKQEINIEKYKMAKSYIAKGLSKVWILNIVKLTLKSYNTYDWKR